MKRAALPIVIALFAFAFGIRTCRAADFESARKSLAGIRGVYVLIEELQPNLQKYNKRAELSAANLLKAVEAQLREAGITVYDREEWLRAAGRPILYVNVNTHEYQKYCFAYDIRIELQQIVYPETSPAARLLATTWSSNTTGAVDPGTVETIVSGVRAGVALFINAYMAGRR